MSPQIALSLCILFISIIFILDIKRKPAVSYAHWVPFIWMMVAGTRSVGYWLNTSPIIAGEKDLTAGDPINRSLLLILIVIGLFILSRRKLDWSYILKSNKWIIVLFLYMGISILWSDYKLVSFKRLVRATGDIIMVLVILTEHDPLVVIERMFRRFAYLFLPLSIVLAKYFPEIGLIHTRWGGHTSWIGLTTDKNELGIVACFCSAFFLWTIIKEYRNNKIFIDIVLLFMSLFLLFYGKAQSATATVVFFLGICIFIALSKLKSNPERIGSYIVSAVIVSLLLIPFSGYIFKTISDSLGRSTTLTNRTVLWQSLLDVNPNSPVFGSGYGSFWLEINDHPMWEDFAYVHHQAHNGYLDVYLQIGLVGLFLLIVLIFVTYKNIIKAFVFNFEYCKFRVTLLTMALAHNITEATFLRGTNFLWFLFVLAVITVPRNYNHKFYNGMK